METVERLEALEEEAQALQAQALQAAGETEARIYRQALSEVRRRIRALVG
jgi:hypothetical protein